jgi:WD40 repeat protein
VTVDRDRKVRLREAATGREVRTFIGNSGRVTVAIFSPDGTRVVTGGADRTVRVWDVESGRELLALAGPTRVVWGLAWDDKHDRLYALDHSVRVWGTSPDTPGPR